MYHLINNRKYYLNGDIKKIYNDQKANRAKEQKWKVSECVKALHMYQLVVTLI